MRGAFVACFGSPNQHKLETVAEAHRWHGGGHAAYHALGRFHTAVLSDPVEGPWVDVRGGRLSLLHGTELGTMAEIQQRGRRFVSLECDTNELQAARDPLGLCPLFFRVFEQALWLSTEVRPLIELGRVEPDLPALGAQAAIAPFDERTGFVGVYRVLPGHVLHATSGLEVTQRPYWDPRTSFASFRGDRKQAEEELWARLLEAVDRGLELKGRTGVLVSGGLDSAAITATGPVLGRPLSLVHVAFHGFSDADEEQYARAAAQRAESELDVVAGDTTAWHPEEDLAVSTIPYLTPPVYTANTGLARFEEQGVAGVLDGNDGDGVLGYVGREWGALALTGQFPRLVRLAKTYGPRIVTSGLANDLIPPPVFRRLRRKPPRDRTYLQHTEDYFLPPLQSRIREINHERWRNPFGEWRWRQLRQVLPVTTGRMEEHELRAARYGIDIRHPFADRALVEFLLSLPVQIKSDPLRSKGLLRDALVGHAPDLVLDRPDKSPYASVLERRVDPGHCLEWIRDSGIKLPNVDYDALYRHEVEPDRLPLFMLILLARAHVFAATYA